MIKAILVFNNHGKPRMTKFFTHYVSTLPSKLSILHDLGERKFPFKTILHSTSISENDCKLHLCYFYTQAG